MAELKRTLGLFDTFSLVISAVVGAGIFAVTGFASRVAGPSLIVSVVIAGAVAVLTSMSIAQLVRRFPKEGGEYEYAYKTLSPFIGFLSGWMWTINKVTADGAVALAFATYLSLFLAGVPTQAVALGIIALVTLINYSGVRTAGNAIDLLVIVNLSILTLFIVIGAFFFRSANFEPFAPFGLEGTLRASAIIFFAYVGFARPIYLVEEIREPTRNVPRGMYLGLAVSIVFYSLITSAAIGLVGSPALGGSESPLATAIGATQIAWAPTLIAVGALFATFSVLLSDNVGLSRMLFAMGRRGDYPRWLGHVDERSRSPRRAIAVTGALTATFVLIVSFVDLVQTASFFILVYFALANLSAARLSGRNYPLVQPVLGIVGTVGLAISLTINVVLAGLALIAVGTAYILVRKRFDRQRP